MKNKNTKTEKSNFLYQLYCEDLFSNETILCRTYRHKSSAYRAKSRLEKETCYCSFWVKPISIAEYNMELVNACLKETHQQKLEEECHKFIELHIVEICTELYTIVYNEDIQKSIKRKLWSGHNQVRKELVEKPEGVPIESIYFSVMPAFRRGRYEFGIGMKTKENEYIENSGSITYDISLSDTFQTLRSRICDLASLDKVFGMLKEMITRQIYKRH